MFTVTIDTLDVTDPNASWEAFSNPHKFATQEEAKSFAYSCEGDASVVQAAIWENGQCLDRFEVA